MAKTIYFLGIGGIGMSALAHYYLIQGDKVFGYDRTPSPITEKLEQEGAIIHFDENVKAIPTEVTFVVRTPAVSCEHLEYKYFVEHKIPIFKRSQVLGKITDEYRTVAVAGTHGKTTTTSMLAQITHKELRTIAFIGGIAKNFDSNFVLDKNPEIAIAEADEFDRSFLTLHPSVAIITSMDADHLDIYGSKSNLEESFNQFATQVTQTLIVNESISTKITHKHKLTYGFDSRSDCFADDLHLCANTAIFTIHYLTESPIEVTLSVSGLHNIANATAAYAAARQLGITPQNIVKHLAEFNGVKRRLDFQIEREDLVYIDDYAHHPEEIRALINSVKAIYPSKKITAVFQPHLYTRTRDFADEFAEVLSLADKIILLPIYPAREEPIGGINSQYLLSLINKDNKMVIEKGELINHLKSHRPEVLLTIGAGDIDRLVSEITRSGL